MVTYYVLNSTY